MRNNWLKLPVSLLVCLLLTALLLTLDTHIDAFLRQRALIDSNTPSQSIKEPTKDWQWWSESLVFFLYLIGYGYWLLFIPSLYLFWWIARRQGPRSKGYYLLLGFALGLVMATLFYGLSCVLPPWSIAPAKANDWQLIALFGLVGSLYGLLYTQWFIPSAKA